MHGGGMMMSLPTNRGAAPHPPVGQPAAMPSELLVDARLLIAAMDAAAGHPPPPWGTVRGGCFPLLVHGFPLVF